MSDTRSHRWTVTRFAQRAATPWVVVYSHANELDPNSLPGCITGGEHATWRDAFDSAVEGAALTSMGEGFTYWVAS